MRTHSLPSVQSISMNNTLNSEERATKILSGIASVPFADSSIGFSVKVQDFFTAIDDLNAELFYNDGLNLFAFFIMVSSHKQCSNSPDVGYGFLSCLFC